jgi:hypothetical protein
MATQLIMEYDASSDTMYLGKCAPYAEQESEEVDYGIVARMNPHTQEIEHLEILFFKQRMAQGEIFQLPIFAQFQLAETA